MKNALYMISCLVLFTLDAMINSPKVSNADVQDRSVQLVPAHLRTTLMHETSYPRPAAQPVLGPSVFPPFIGSAVIGFKEALAFKESSGNYFEVNTLGYLGKYQFGTSTLKTVGIYNSQRFLTDPRLQEEAFYTNLSRNKWILRREIKSFSGKDINGIEITESGILAAAHLAGPGNVKRYIRSNGEIDVSDSYGTSLSDYLHGFSGFDLSMISAKPNPRIGR